MAAPLVMDAISRKAQMDQRERLFNREMAASAGILAGQDAALRPKPMTTAGSSGMSPAALLAGAGSAIHEGSSDPMPTRQPMAAQQQTVGAGPLAGIEDDPRTYTPLTEEQVYEMYRRAADERTQNQIQMADEMDVARGWQRADSQKKDLKRSLMAIQNAMDEQSGNAAMVLVPHAQDAKQAKQILSSEYLKLLQRYKPLEQEWKLWDEKRNELGIDQNEINTEPGIAQWLNRLRQKQHGGPGARPGARSVLPAPSRGVRPGSGRGY